MKIKDLKNEDINNLSYEELAQMILIEKNSKMKIIDIFKEICELKNMSESDFENKIADFYDLISTNKEFLVLEKGFCDLRKNHTPKVTFDEEDINEENDESTENEDDEENDDIFYDNSSEEDDVNENEDELADFMVVDEDDEQNM